MVHKCIKATCSNTYTDPEPDAYYCPSCLKEHKRIAEEIDKKRQTGSTVTGKSEYQSFLETAKTYKTPDGRTVLFGKA